MSCAAVIYSDVNSSDKVAMGKDKKKKGKGKEKTAEKTEKKLKSKVLKKTGEVSFVCRASPQLATKESLYCIPNSQSI